VRILILKPSSLGDVVQALPVLRMLKAHWPEGVFHWWIAEELRPLLEDDPDLEQLWVFRRHRWRSPLRWHEALAHVGRLRAAKFDLVLDLQALARSAVVAWLANAELTVGLDDPREGAGTFYDLRVARPSRFTHAVDWYLETVKALGAPVRWDFDWLPARPAVARAVRARLRFDASRFIALCPAARWVNKRWPIEHFCQTARQIADARPDLGFVVLGGLSDRPLGGAIRNAVGDRCRDLTGGTSLPEMVECLRESELLITNDTGPMHAAAALGKPVVALFGPTDPRRTGPYGQQDRVLTVELPCRPCLKPVCHYERPVECLRAIRPERVTAEVFDRLNSGGREKTIARKQLEPRAVAG
jgi:lipopolysaccharide heptosyltransferase II